jgi:hypothetical protein
MDWQVQVEVTVNVDDCVDEAEVIARVQRCLKCAKLSSIKKMWILDVAKG